MSTFIILVHVVVCVALILIVLLQTGKGADMGVAFGGGSSRTLFGSSGASSFLSKLTTGAAVVFMLTSLSLAYLSSHRSTSSIMSDVVAPKTEQTQQAPAESPVKSEDPLASAEAPVPEPAEKE
ncbi:MAG: preprotein translocase subunit SecG [Desulfobacterales bacterium]|nr:preprotein translocase subunit SecG [Desulfobacterales bacterium]